MDDIEWIRDLRKQKHTIEEIGCITGIGRELVRRVLRKELPPEITLREFNLCPYGQKDCHTFRDDLCVCNLIDTQFFCRPPEKALPVFQG